MNLADELLSELIQNMEVSFDGTTWSRVTAAQERNGINLAARINALSGTETLVVRVRAMETADALASDPVVFTINARPPAPTAATNGFHGRTDGGGLQGTGGMQWRRGSGAWSFATVNGERGGTPAIITAEMTGQGNSAANISVRVAPQVDEMLPGTTATPASTAVTLNIPNSASAPSASFNARTGMVTGVGVGLEYYP